MPGIRKACLIHLCVLWPIGLTAGLLCIRGYAFANSAGAVFCLRLLWAPAQPAMAAEKVAATL
jgi:hypothetical protein